MIVEAVCVIETRGIGHGTPLHILPKNRKEDVAHCPACHCQFSDDRRPFYVLPFDGQVNRLAITGLTDEAGVVIKVGKDFEEDFDRELEN